MLDLIASLIFLITQWRLAVLLLRRIRLLEPRWRKPACAAMILCGILIVAGYACAHPELTAPFGITSLAAPMAGAVALAYLITSAIGLALYTALGPLRKRWNADPDPGRRRVLRFASRGIVASPFAAVAYGTFINRTDFQIREVDLPFLGLPSDLDGLHLLQLSDIHLSVFLSERELEHVIDMTRDLRPNIAFATGDFISTVGDPLEACIRQLACVKADAGMFGCLGNHERYAQAEQQATEIALRSGIPILRGEARLLRFGKAQINLVGVDYQSIFRKKTYLAGADRLVRPGAFNVLLSHNPDVFPVAARQGYDLVLSGHTHGGQVTVEILSQDINPARFITPFVRGIYRHGHSLLYVTRGIGTIGIPARLGAPPEISLLRLRRV